MFICFCLKHYELFLAKPNIPTGTNDTTLRGGLSLVFRWPGSNTLFYIQIVFHLIFPSISFCPIAPFFSWFVGIFWERSYNHFHKILRLFDVLTNFHFTTSETMRDFTYKHSIYELSHELPNDLRLWKY